MRGQSVRGENGKCGRTSEGDTDTDWQAQLEQLGGLRVSREPELSRVSEPLPSISSDLEPSAVFSSWARLHSPARRLCSLDP